MKKRFIAVLLAVALMCPVVGEGTVLQQGVNGYEGCQDAFVSHNGFIDLGDNKFIMAENSVNYDTVPVLAANFCPS